MEREMTGTADDVEAWRQRIGRVGVWLSGAARGAVEAATTVQRLGYRALWIGGSNRDAGAFADLGAFLGATGGLVVATGIADIWAWDPAALEGTVAALDSAHPGRFLLGLGVSHPQTVAGYRRPLSAMRDFLDGLDRAAAAGGRRPPFRVLAALRQKMLELSRDRAGGAHPYFTTPQHTAFARRVLGAAPLLAPEQAVVLETDPVQARAIARRYMETPYLSLTNYLSSLRELGFGERDFAGGGSDRLVDAIVAWGSPDAIAARVREHLEAGADHVAIQPLDEERGLALDQLRSLAPALLDAGG
jgi:probable F420-dependent oxidoreductase